jgi:type VI protein secretion system component VasK
VRYITEREKQIVLAAFSDLENLVNQYREAVMGVTFGNDQADRRPIKQATKQRMKELQEMITGLLSDIDEKTQ